jgi:hypothetical protein
MMHLVVSSKRSRSAALCSRSRVGSRPSVMRNGLTALDRLDEDRRAEVLHEHLAGEPVDAVDAHRVGPADAVRARAPERQRPVLVPLDLVQRVDQAVALLDRHLEVLPVGVGVDLRVIAADPHRDGAELARRLRRRRRPVRRR